MQEQPDAAARRPNADGESRRSLVCLRLAESAVRLISRGDGMERGLLVGSLAEVKRRARAGAQGSAKGAVGATDFVAQWHAASGRRLTAEQKRQHRRPLVLREQVACGQKVQKRNILDTKWTQRYHFWFT
jgi:hypothetical protein